MAHAVRRNEVVCNRECSGAVVVTAPVLSRVLSGEDLWIWSNP